ncbi:type II toxin-antitoxin system HicB family antitoxin, partial [Candidatus Magnetobacterium casense]
MPYDFKDYTVKIFFDERDDEFGAFIEDIPEVSAYGQTREEAISALSTVFEQWKQIATEKNLAIPPPSNLKEYSGRFVLRIPKSLHKRLEEKAKEDNVSLNQEAIYCI